MPALQRDKTPLRAELTHGYYEDWPRERYLNVMAKETEEMLKTGVVTLCCPECNEPTAVNRNSCGGLAQCLCRFIRKRELLEI